MDKRIYVFDTSKDLSKVFFILRETYERMLILETSCGKFQKYLVSLNLATIIV